MDDFLYRQALDVAIERGFLLGRHRFIDGLWYNDKRIMQREWKKNALYAEANWSYNDVKDHGTHGTLEENLAIMREWHSTYGHFYTDAVSYRRTMKEDRPAFERSLQAGGIGYRIVLDEAAYTERILPGHQLLLRQTWVNRNMVRLHKRYILTLSLADAKGNLNFSEPDRSFDPTGWIRGEEYSFTSVFHLPKNLEPGTCRVLVAMTNVDNTHRIALAIEGKDDQLRYDIGQITIE